MPEYAPSLQEHRYTSTGIKFWRHKSQMRGYRKGNGHTVISTHVSPEGACNLRCPFCSVTHRDTHRRIALDVIMDYIDRLVTRGLKAVILTGGGEPTAYPQFNALVQAIRARKLKLALITNGTLTDKVEPVTWAAFDWIRVSINFFPSWKEAISLPISDLREDCVVGCSVVFGDHEIGLTQPFGWRDRIDAVRQLADQLHAEYIRVLPNCLHNQEDLLNRHRQLEQVFRHINDPRFFHQYKVHGAPTAIRCHQAYFRPYLSEEPNPWNEKPGTVFPCDSVVLNAPTKDAEGFGKFMRKYALCKPEDVGEFMDGKIPQPFAPLADCEGCVFTHNVEMLDDWYSGGTERFRSHPLDHESFV